MTRLLAFIGKLTRGRLWLLSRPLSEATAASHDALTGAYRRPRTPSSFAVHSLLLALPSTTTAYDAGASPSPPEFGACACHFVLSTICVPAREGGDLFRTFDSFSDRKGVCWLIRMGVEIRRRRKGGRCLMMAKHAMRLLVMLVLISACSTLVPATESRLPTLAGSRVPMKYFDSRPLRYVQIFGARDSRRRQAAR